jgi:hypothetical protein
MKEYLPKYGQLTIVIIFISFTCLLPSCIAELGLEAGVAEELAVAEASGELAGAEAMIEAEAVAGEAAEAGAITEDLSLLRNNLVRNSAGEMVVADAENMNGLLGKIKLERATGELPKLYVEGKTNPIAEVYPESGRFKIFRTGNIHSFPDDIFSVEGDAVRVRSSAEISPNNILTTVNHGKLLVKLAEKDGWYQIKCVENSKAYMGWINAAYALPVVALMNKDKDKEEISFVHPDENKIKNDLIGKRIPGWNFSFLSEFQNIQITKEAIENGYLVQTVDLKLKDAYNSNLFDSEIIVKYCNTPNNGWVLSDVTSKYFSKILQNSQSNYGPKSYPHGNPIFTSNVIISTKMRGQFTVRKNVSCTINSNGVILGDLILNKDAELNIYGVITGSVYNYGGKITNYNNRSVRVIDCRTAPIGTVRLNNRAPRAKPQFRSSYRRY